jgi:hypothetical protein
MKKQIENYLFDTLEDAEKNYVSMSDVKLHCRYGKEKYRVRDTSGQNAIGYEFSLLDITTDPPTELAYARRMEIRNEQGEYEPLWMFPKADLPWNEAAATLGRIGGSSTSDAKTTAARANGAKGGRPKKTD